MPYMIAVSLEMSDEPNFLFCRCSFLPAAQNSVLEGMKSFD